MAKPVRIVALAAVATMALAACSGGSGGGSGDGGDTLIISTDLPLQGQSKDVSDATNQAIELYLESVGYKAGKYTVKLQKYDDSTAAAGKWDSAKCSQNATAHMENKNEVAVVGTYNSGCAQIQIPVLNQDPTGPMLMVSHANTNPGLTQTWPQEPGAPEKYYPSGVHNYARVVTTDDIQGKAAAVFAAETLGVKKVYVLNDNDIYGKGIAEAFAKHAKEASIEVAANEPWDSKAPDYKSLFGKVKQSGADAVYLGGIYDNNGGQLVRDKVSVLGDNNTVQLMGPDGFTGYEELNKLPQGQGMYLTFTGLTTDQLKATGGAGAKVLDSYRARYGKEPPNYALYGVAATQVILAAIEASDGTRKGVRDAVFADDGITVPADISVLGKDIHIDARTGDTTAKDISVEQIKDNVETFLKAESVS